MKKEEQLLNDLTELIKETQKNKVDWKVDCQTTEYNDLQEKPVHEEEGERWIVPAVKRRRAAIYYLCHRWEFVFMM